MTNETRQRLVTISFPASHICVWKSNRQTRKEVDKTITKQVQCVDLTKSFLVVCPYEANIRKQTSTQITLRTIAYDPPPPLPHPHRSASPAMIKNKPTVLMCYDPPPPLPQCDRMHRHDIDNRLQTIYYLLTGLHTRTTRRIRNKLNAFCLPAPNSPQMASWRLADLPHLWRFPS